MLLGFILFNPLDLTADIGSRQRYRIMGSICVQAFPVVGNEASNRRRLIDWREGKNGGGDGEQDEFHESSF